MSSEAEEIIGDILNKCNIKGNFNNVANMTIDELLDYFDDNIKIIYEQASKFYAKHREDDIVAPEDLFLCSMGRTDLNLSVKYASKLGRVNAYLDMNEKFLQCLGPSEAVGDREWDRRLRAYGEVLATSLNKARTLLGNVGEVKKKSDDSAVNGRDITSTVAKLYSSCKKKLSGVTKKGVFGRNLVKRFFNKYFSSNGKDFSRKCLKKLEKDKSNKMLNKIKADIKRECLKLLSENNARELLTTKFNKWIKILNLNVSLKNFAGLSSYMSRAPVDSCRRVYEGLKNFGKQGVLKDDKGKGVLIDFASRKDNFFKGGKPMYAYQILPKLNANAKALGEVYYRELTKNLRVILAGEAVNKEG